MRTKLQKITNNAKFKKLFALCAAVMVLGSMFVTSACAVDATSDMSAQQAAETIFEAVAGDINVGTVVSVIGVALGAALALYFAWWGIRKVIRIVKGGLNGKIKV